VKGDTRQDGGARRPPCARPRRRDRLSPVAAKSPHWASQGRHGHLGPVSLRGFFVATQEPPSPID
jgi:hypothetical protein